MKALKYLKWTAIGVTGLFLSVVLFLAIWIDPNDYRDDVTALVKDKTGLILEIKGNIGWNFFPAIGFSVEQLSLTTAEGEAPLAAIGKAAVSVQLMPLFQRRINVNTLFIDGLTANLVVDESGKGNWEALLGEGQEETPAPAEQTAGPAPEINLPQVVVTNATLDYVDRATPAHYTVVLSEFVADDISLDREFAFRLLASADDHKGLKAGIDLRSFVQLDMAAETYRVRALELKGDIAGILEKPFQVTVGTDAVANLKTQQVNVERLAVDASNLYIGGKPARATLAATVTGNLETMLFNVSKLDVEANDLVVGAKPVRVKLGADVVADLKQQVFNVDALVVDAANLDFTGKPVAANVQGKVTANLTDDTASVGPLRFSAAGVNGTVAVDVRELTKELAWQGTLDIEPFNAKEVMRGVGIDPPKTTDPQAMTRVALKSALAGTLASAMLDNLDIRLDQSTIRGKAGITDLKTTALVFDLALDNINADGYLPPPAPEATAAAVKGEATAGAAKPGAAAKPEPLLPVETLRTLNLQGKLAAGKITFMEWPMTRLALGVRAKDGDIRVDPINASVLDGSISGSVRIDARGNEPRIITALKLNRVEIGPVVQRYAKKDLFLGKASLNLDMDATGNDMDTLLKKAIGSADFSFADATLRGVNLNNVLTEALTQQLGAFAMLMPDYQQKLPKELEQDTVLKTLAAGVKLKDGVAEMPALNAGVKDGKVSGQGSFNLLSLDFDYRMAMRTDRLKGNKYLANAEFPVQCRGNVSGAPADWCRPDTRAMGDMLKKAAENAARDKLKGELAQKLGVESVDTGALKEQAKQEAQQAVEQQKDEAEQKAKERAAEELQKRLKKIF
ncbi:MAG: AsmA family protein [Gammaproteobacteria bacterium]